MSTNLSDRGLNLYCYSPTGFLSHVFTVIHPSFLQHFLNIWTQTSSSPGGEKLHGLAEQRPNLGAPDFFTTHPQLGMLLDFLSLGVADEVVVQHDVRPQAQRFSSDRPEDKSRVAVGEVIAKELRVFKMHWLSRRHMWSKLKALLDWAVLQVQWSALIGCRCNHWWNSLRLTQFMKKSKP